MRNLKRVLSLAMASVMLLGMMVIGAGAADKTAADLTDSDKITNKEAVSLMVDLGIIVGKPDGSFAPTETIDRATMSKLIYFILMGTADETAFKGIPTPLTDVKGNWAEGFINYCYSMKIVAGTGNNTYNPNGKVTTASAAKMLLVALGYDAKLSKYENDAMWSINIMRDAQSAGLLAGVTQRASDELTRDNAAQMIYNTLNAKTVTPRIDRDMGVEYLDGYNAKLTTLGYETYNLVKVTATVTGVASGKATLSNVAPALANSYVNNKLPATNDVVGKNVVIYVKGTMNTTTGTVTAVEKLISSTLAVGDSVVLATVVGKGIANLTNATTSSHKDFLALLEDAPAAAANAAPTVTYYVNGAATSGANRYGNGTSDAAAGGYAADGTTVNTTVNVGTIVAKKGVIVEFVDTDNNGKANIVKITEKRVDTVTGKVETKVVDGKTQVRVPGVTGLSSYNSNNTTASVFGFEGLSKDDIVLSYTANGNYYIEKADSFSGRLTATKGGTDLIIGGSTYKVSGLTGSVSFAGVVAEGYNADVTYWIDNGGNIVAAEADEEIKAEYAIVTGWRDAGSFGEVSIEAKLLMADGTTKTVKVSKFAATQTGTLADIDVVSDFAIGFATSTSGAAPVTYSIDKDGNYRLKLIAGAGDDSVVALVKAAIHNNKGQFVTDNDSTDTGAGKDVVLTGNAKTAFLIKDGSKIETLTGIANAPKYTAGANGADGVALVDKDGITVMVYITAGVNEGTSTTVDRAYIIDNTSRTYYPAVTGSHDAYYEYDAIVAGEKTTIKVLVGSAAASDITANTIYALTLNKDGLVTGVTRSTGWDTGVKYLDGVVRVGASSYYTYESASKIYVIDGDSVNTVNAADIAEDAQASVLFVQKNATDVTVIKELYIVKNNVDLPTALNITTTGTATAAGANDELLTEQGIVTAAAAADTVIVTSVTAAGTTAEVKISGAGTTITGTDATNGTATYTLVAGDIGSTLTVTVKVTETATGATQTLKYQIKVS